MKIALTQDVITGGGRIVVLIEIVSLLNEMGYTPDILTFAMNLTSEDIAQKYRRNIAFNLVIVRPTIFNKLPEINKLWFNWLVRRRTQSYDLLIDSNNTVTGLGNQTRTLSYMHYPRIDRVTRKEALVLERDRPLRLKTRLAHALDYFLAGLLHRYAAFPDQVRVIANSDFTRTTFLKYYPTIATRMKVIYPPVRVSNQKLHPSRKRQVVTLGRFSVLKRQLDQVKLARQLPAIEFIIMGFAPEKSTYLAACSDYIKQHAITNVQLRPNEPYEEVQRVLRSARYFLHTLAQEPFGITTVEAIAAGCIPIVHNSGGQREIVPFPELRFDTLSEAVAILQQLEGRDVTKLHEQLISHIQQFDNSEFKRKFAQTLETVGVSAATRNY